MALTSRRMFGIWCASAAFVATSACNAPMVLTQQVEARRVTLDLQVQFTKAADAANRSVMSDTDDDAKAAAREAEQATQAVLRDVGQLESILKSMGYSEELRFLDTFSSRFAEYQKLDAEILPLAIENTNVKAQRLSFGPAREAADAFRTALEAAIKMARADDASRADALAARAILSVLEIEVLQAPHIAEAEDAPMTRMEAQMAASEAAARKGLERIKSLLPPEAGPHLTAAVASLDRFKTINDTLGHAAGDALLAEAARAIVAQARMEDVVGRIGGDEFVMICRGVCRPPDALAVAARLQKALARTVAVADRSVRVSASVGITMAVPGSTLQALMNRADEAMYSSWLNSAPPTA